MILKNGKRIDGLGDSMPIGSIVEYNGTDIPDGWEILPGDANVYVGSAKPMEGQEIWIKKGKNLLNMNKVKNGWGLTSNLESQGFVEDANWFLSHPIPVEGGKPYFTSGLYYANGDIQTFKEFYDKDHNFILNVKSNPAIAPDNAAYMYVDGRIDKSNEAMVVQGTQASAYEPYLGKKIFVKNDEGVYEEFYNEEEYNKNHYSSKECRIGTWINGKPIYRKCFTLDTRIALDNGHTKMTTLAAQGIIDWEDITHIGFTVKDDHAGYFSNGFYTNETDTSRCWISSDWVMFLCGTTYGCGDTTFIIEYTKTTD